MRKFILDEWVENCNVPIILLSKKFKRKTVSHITNCGVNDADRRESLETKEEVHQV